MTDKQKAKEIAVAEHYLKVAQDDFDNHKTKNDLIGRALAQQVDWMKQTLARAKETR